MGRFFAGVSKDAVQQQVAIKIMRGDFQSEVAACSALLPHPHIVTLLDVGLFKFAGMEDAAVGLVFEAFDVDLRAFLKKQALNSAGTRHILRSAFKALQYVHERGVVHADVKLANILLRGVGPFRGEFRKLLEAATPPSGCVASTIGDTHIEADCANYMPWCFKVGSSPPNVLGP